MTLQKAVHLLEAEYLIAKRMDFVKNPLAYALYQVWKMADNDSTQPQKENER